MRFMLLQNYGEVESHCRPMNEWTPEDIKAHIDFQNVLNDELTKSGELVDAQGLAGPDQAKFVSDGEQRYLTTQAARLAAPARLKSFRR